MKYQFEYNTVTDFPSRLWTNFEYDLCYNVTIYHTIGAQKVDIWQMYC